MFETARLYDETLPLLESVLAGTAVTMKRRYMQRLDRLITKYQAQADNPGLKRALVGLRRDLRRPQFLASFGISIERGGRPDSLAGEGVD